MSWSASDVHRHGSEPIVTQHWSKDEEERQRREREEMEREAKRQSDQILEGLPAASDVKVGELSMPSIGTFSDHLGWRTQRAGEEYRSGVHAMDAYTAEAERLQRGLTLRQRTIGNLQVAYEADPSERNGQRLLKTAQEMDNYSRRLEELRATIEKAGANIQTDATAYEANRMAAQQYAQDQQQLWQESWGAVRRPAEIQADLDRIRASRGTGGRDLFMRAAQGQIDERQLQEREAALYREMTLAEAMYPDERVLTADEQAFQRQMTDIQALPREDQSLLKTYAEGYWQDNQAKWDSNQALLALIQKGYKHDQIEQMADTWRRAINAQAMGQIQEGAAAEVNAGWGSGTMANIKATGANLLGSAGGALQAVAEAGMQKLYGSQYQGIDPNLQGYRAGAYAGAVREATKKNAQAVGGEGSGLGKALGAVYGATASAIDNAARIIATGKMSLLLAGTGAFTEGVRDASMRGADTNQALLMGLASGGLEILTEKVSLDRILKEKNPQTFVDWIKEIAKQGGVEASEEEASLIGNLIADALIMGDNSELQRSIKKGMRDGLSKVEATKKAWKAVGMEALETAVESFLSGGMMAGGQLSAQKLAPGRALAKADMTAEEKQEMLNEAMEAPEGSKARALAEKYTSKGVTGENMKKVQLMRLYDAMYWESKEGKAVAEGDEQAAREAAEENLGLRPESDDVPDSNVGNMEDQEAETDQEMSQNTEQQNAAEPVQQTQQQAVQPQQDQQGPKGLRLGQAFENEEVKQDGRTEAAAAQEASAEDGQQRTGTQVPDAGQERTAGVGAGVQTGKLGVLSGEPAGKPDAKAQRRDRFLHLKRDLREAGEQPVSTQDLGFGRVGTERKSVTVVPEQMWDRDMQEAAAAIRTDTGAEVVMVSGQMEVLKGNRKDTAKTRGIFIPGKNGAPGKILIQADNARVTPQQLADHEIYHAKVREFKGVGMDLNKSIREALAQKYGREQLNKIIDQYVEAMAGIYEANSEEQARAKIEEEVFADAYAGINSFGAGADKLYESMDEAMNEHASGREARAANLQSNGTRETRGPSRAEDQGKAYSVDDDVERPTNGVPYKTGKSYRAVEEKEGPISRRMGFGMFADDPNRVMVGYGEKLYEAETAGLPMAEDFAEKIANAWDRAVEDWDIPGNLEYLIEDGVTGREIAEMFAPKDIVDSADAWDNEDMVQWLLDSDIIDFDQVRGIKTPDGAIIFDEDLAKVTDKDADVIGRDEHGGPKSKVGKEIEEGLEEAMDNLEGNYGRPASREAEVTTQQQEIWYSIEHDEEYMQKAIKKNKQNEKNLKKGKDAPAPLSAQELQKAAEDRAFVKTELEKIRTRDPNLLPPDKTGDTFYADEAYGGTEENSTVCVRSMVADAFVDRVAEMQGRPLTVEEQLFLCQDMQNLTKMPECLYCYVATDRKSYRAFLGRYLQQRDQLLKWYKEDTKQDKDALLTRWLAGREPTDKMKDRVFGWIDMYEKGKPMLRPDQLAKMADLTGDDRAIGEAIGKEYVSQARDAMAYAQSASWAKKRNAYYAYNNHILRWRKDRIQKLNAGYGLRMYSFSDYSPAYLLENMQMVTDAAIKGLKVLAYTKDIDFAKIFAPTGMNINISVFGAWTPAAKKVTENNIIGADWEEAKKLRADNPNVGITFVATNDDAVRWALDQEWIDVVIPYHLVRTGKQVAEALKYHNYKGEQEDRKVKGEWRDGVDEKFIPPTEHNNDKEQYFEALKRNHLTARFERFQDHPNYMKLVNEFRLPASEGSVVKPVFDMKAVPASLARLSSEGYAKEIGAAGYGKEIGSESGKEEDPVMTSYNNLRKHKQLEIIKESNPADDDVHAWIRDIEDIMTYPEALKQAEQGEDFDPSYTWAQAEKAKANEAITVYSSYPIKNGTFVTPSKMEAKDYAGGGKIYSKTVNTNDVAWIDATQGQYAEVHDSFEDTVYSVDDQDYMDAIESGNEQEAREMVKDAAERAGYNLELYHQTESEFTKFNTEHEFAGRSDTDTPTGFFFKPTSQNIGLRGDNQMHVFVKADDMLEFRNRDEIHRYWMDHVKGYKKLQGDLDALDKKYDAIYEEEEEKSDQWYEENYDDYVAGRIGYEEAMEHMDAPLTRILEEWKAKENPIRAEMKKLITDYMHGTEHDGIHLKFDGRRAGVDVETYIVFDPGRIKSANTVVRDDDGNVVPLSDRFNDGNPDIRFSAEDDQREMESKFGKAEAKAMALTRETKDMILREELGDEGFRNLQKFKKDQKTVAIQEHLQELQETRDKKRAALRDLKETVRNQDKATIAKQQFRQNAMALFSTGKGMRGELGKILDTFADRVIRKESIGYEDRQWLFDQLYNSGVMTIAKDDVYAEGRQMIAKGRIYVPDSVKHEFGDDWNDFRRKAFAEGVYLTNDRSNGAIDQWNIELAAELPGLFDAEETDLKEILERIVDVAEEGKAEQVSLAEYTAMLAGEEHVSEQEVLDGLERKLDGLIRVLEDGAELEKRLNWKLAKDHFQRGMEKLNHAAAAQRTRENQELRGLQQELLKKLQWLNRHKNQAPEDLRQRFQDAIGDLDILAVGVANEMNWSNKYNATWEDIDRMYTARKTADPTYPESPDMEEIHMRLNSAKIGDMDIDAVSDLLKLATGLQTELHNRNNVITEDEHAIFADVYDDMAEEIKSAPKRKTDNGFDKLFNAQQLTPMNVMQRMVGWNPDSTFMMMARQMEEGERTIRAYQVEAARRIAPFLEKNREWVKKADGQGKNGIWEKISIPPLIAMELGKPPVFGKAIEVEITPMMKIHMYLESKNEDNLRHMMGGRTFADKELYQKGERARAFSEGNARTIKLAPETVRAIVSKMSPVEMELAKLLEDYYNGYAKKEMNRVSNIVNGFDKAIGKHYAPIYSDANYTHNEVGKTDTTAAGVSRVKSRIQGAKNPTWNLSALDAFERHVDEMSRYVGMTIPARNWNRLLAWQKDGESTKSIISQKWSMDAVRYIENLLRDLQSRAITDRDIIDQTFSKMESGYITAVFGLNPSIVLKQLGSVPMAAPFLGTKNMPSPKQVAGIDTKLIGKYTQELQWRTMGYSMPETKQLKDNPNWTQENRIYQFLAGGGAITAMDGWAASVLWPWAENKVRREHPELKKGTQEQIDAGESPFYKAVAKEFNMAVSRSQSVSDQTHQSTLRKSRNPLARTFTLFGSDTAQTYNALRQKHGEALYFKRTNQTQKQKQAKQELGQAVLAMLINNSWSAAITMLMALWKHRDKRYRDEDGNLTWGSAVKAAMQDMAGAMAGVVIGGEELADLIGNILTGRKWYDISTMGLDLLNDTIKTIGEEGNRVREFVVGLAEVIANKGSVEAYWKEKWRDLLGGIKKLSTTAASFFGLPLNNLEAYLVGSLRTAWPQMGTAYDDVFHTPEKTDLTGLTGEQLRSRMRTVLRSRGIRLDLNTINALAMLYEKGESSAFPGSIPDSVKVNGEDRDLSLIQQQTYNEVWKQTVEGSLDKLVSVSAWALADDAQRQKMLSRMYDFAATEAKAALFDDYELSAGEIHDREILTAGADLSQLAAWKVRTYKRKGYQKAEELRGMKLPEKAKRKIFEHEISGSREEDIEALAKTGVKFETFLQLYGKYAEIENEEGLQAKEKAVKFSRWLDNQSYTKEQKVVIKESLKYFGMTGADAGRYDKLTDAGMSHDKAYKMAEALDKLEPEEGSDKVTDLQRWKTVLRMASNKKDQMIGLSETMSDSQYKRMTVAGNHQISPADWIRFQELKPRFDADGNGSLKSDEVTAAVNSMTGLSQDQKAALWQLTVSSSTKAKNNPYSSTTGERVRQEMGSGKEKEAKGSGSFADEIMRQLTGG